MSCSKNREYHRGDVFWADLDCFSYDNTENSSIYRKIRPVVLVSNDKCNEFSPIVTVLPLTTRVTKGTHIPTKILLKASENPKLKNCLCSTEQPISLPRTRLLEYITTLTEKDMCNISGGLRIQLQLN